MILYCELVHRIIRDMAARLPTLRHVDADQVAVAAAPRAARGQTGGLAACHGLAERRGPTFSIWCRRRTRTAERVSEWHATHPRGLTVEGRAMRYLITLRLPRMLEHDPLPTIAHEMLHIGRRCDGRLRAARHGKTFDRAVNLCVAHWRRDGDPELVALAGLRLPELEERFGAVAARAWPAREPMQTTARVEAPEHYAEAVARLFPGYTLARKFRIEPIEGATDELPEALDAGEFELRHYHAAGSTAMPASALRYARGLEPTGS